MSCLLSLVSSVEITFHRMCKPLFLAIACLECQTHGDFRLRPKRVKFLSGTAHFI